MSTGTLIDRRNDFTRQLILDAGVAQLEESGASQLTFRAVAKRAKISERTVFRYFASRDELLDAIAEEARARMTLPPAPRSIAELQVAARHLYQALEAKQQLVVAGLHSEIFDRLREGAARTRWSAVRKLIDAHAPKVEAHKRRIVAANICYYLGASTWHYYRAYFGMSLEDSILAAETAIRLSIDSLTARVVP